MATVGTIANWVIKRQAQGYNRVSDVLPIINECHKLFYKHESSQGIITAANGRLPYLTTSDGVYDYDAPVVDGVTPWCVSGIFLRGYDNNDYHLSENELSERPVQNTTDYMQFGGNYYYKYLFVHSFDALEGVVSKIKLTRNPGDTTAKYHLLMYKTPTEITSDRQQLQLPDRDGAHLLYFFPAVMKIIEGQNNGNYIEAAEYIETKLKPAFWRVMNSGCKGRRGRTMPRPW